MEVPPPERNDGGFDAGAILAAAQGAPDVVADMAARARELHEEKKQVSKALKLAKAKRDRILKKAQGLSMTDIAGLMIHRCAQAKAKAKAKAKARA